MSQNYTDGDAGAGDGESMASYNEARPAFYIGQHDSARTETLTDMQYGQVLNSGVSHPEIRPMTGSLAVRVFVRSYKF